MGQWNEAKIGEIAEVKGGKRIPKGRKLIKEPNSHPYIRIRNLGKTKYMQLNTDYEYVDEETQQMIARYIVNQGDILISVVGTIGLVGIVGNTLDKANQTENCDKIINIKKVLSEYLYYYLVSSFGQDEIKKGTVGAVQPKLPLKNVKDIIVKYPPIKEQKQIVEILSAIDEKIELNETINNNLLQQLHVLYLRLFCDSAMDTPLGDVVATTSGGTPSRKHDEYYSDSSICWVKSKELLGNYIHETEEHINDLAIKKSSAKLLPEHSVLIAMYGATVGAYGVISKPMTCNQAVCALLCNENYPYTYLFQIAYESQQKFINLAVGSAQQNISQVLIKHLNLHSDLDIIQKFHGFALPMHKEIESLQAENMRLSALRDNLLPKLMSGELDVSNIDL
jgi:type I restriction enzyme S subunit